MNTLHLTTDERRAFDALPAALREGWETVEETGTAYESDEALRIRAYMSSLGDLPHVKAILDEARAGRITDLSGLQDIPERHQKELFFTIGATGLSFIIAGSLKTATTDDDIEGIAWLSKIRHELLENNASIAYA